MICLLPYIIMILNNMGGFFVCLFYSLEVELHGTALGEATVEDSLFDGEKKLLRKNRFT